MREHASDLRPYEIMVVVAPSVGEEGLPAALERVQSYLTTYGATVKSETHDNPWGRRRLAYQIDDHRDAFYSLIMFDAEPARVVDIERELKLDDHVIRHLVVRYDPMTEHEERAPRQQAGDSFSPQPARRTQPPAVAPTAEAVAGPEAAAEPDAILKELSVASAPADEQPALSDEPATPDELTTAE